MTEKTLKKTAGDGGKDKGMYAEMTEQLLEGKLITGASSALITGPRVNRRLRATLQERMERWEEGGMVRGGIIGWEMGGGEGGIQGGKKGTFERAISSQSIQRDLLLKMKCRTAATDRYSGKIYC